MKQNKLKISKGFSSIALVAIVIVVLVLVSLMAIKNLKVGKFQQVSPPIEQDNVVRKLESQSNSDEVGAIEQDINSTQLDSLDIGIEEVDKALDNLK